jgi:hypothetical protein
VICHSVSDADDLSDSAASDWLPMNQNNMIRSNGNERPRCLPIGCTIGIASSAALSSKFTRGIVRDKE